MTSNMFLRAPIACCFVVALAASVLAEESIDTAGQTFRDTLGNGEVGPELVVIPAGSFVMGSSEDEEGHDLTESPQVEVTIAKPFAAGIYEVTWDEWEACVSNGGCDDNSDKKYGPGTSPEVAGDAGFGRGSRPVVNVSWNDADAYVKWLSAQTGETYRLPSETEWEYAARAGSSSRYNWGDASPTCESGKPNTANFSLSTFDGACNGRQTEPVGFSAVNAFGLHDMHGNVNEWTQDCFHVYLSGVPTDGSAWLTDCQRNGNERMIRGGSWSSMPVFLRSARREAKPPSRRDYHIGFRVVRELKATPQ